MSRIFLNGVTDDLLQMISQYSMEVYFKLRLVSKAVKKVIDEVLPVVQDEGKMSLRGSWRVQFLKRAHWCGFKLLDQRDFEDWIEAIRLTFAFKDNLGDIVEKFCRDYLPKIGCIDEVALYCLCRLNRKDYVRELWEEAKHKFNSIAERFPPNYIGCISMLKDFEFFKMVFDICTETLEHHGKGLSVYQRAVSNSYHCRSWKNYRYLVEEVPNLANVSGFEYLPFFNILCDYWKWLPDIKSQDKDKVMQVIEQNGNLLLFVDESFRKDKDIVMTAVKQDGKTIEFSHESLQMDRDIVMAAVKKTCDALQFAHKSLRKDRDIVMTAVTGHSFTSALEYAHESLRKDRDIVMEAVKKQFGSLKFAHESLRKDRDIVMEAVKSCGSQLEFADQSLRKDKDIVLQAVRVRGYALRHADESFRRDPEVVLEAFQKHIPALTFADASLFQDEKFILKALKMDERFLKYAHNSVKKDKEIVMRVVKLNRQSLQYVDKSLQNDPDLLLLASKQDKPSRKRKRSETE